MKRPIDRPEDEGLIAKASEIITPSGFAFTRYTFTDEVPETFTQRIAVESGKPAYAFFAYFNGNQVIFRNHKPFDYTDKEKLADLIFQLRQRRIDSPNYILSTLPSDYALTKRRGAVLRRTAGYLVDEDVPEWISDYEQTIQLRSRTFMFEKISQELGNRSFGLVHRCSYDPRLYFAMKVVSRQERGVVLRKLELASKAMTVAYFFTTLTDCMFYGLNGNYVDVYEQLDAAYYIFPYPPGVSFNDKWRLVEPAYDRDSEKSMFFLILFCWFYSRHYKIEKLDDNKAVALKHGMLFMDFQHLFEKSVKYNSQLPVLNVFSGPPEDYMPFLNQFRSNLIEMCAQMGSLFGNQIEFLKARASDVVAAIGPQRNIAYLENLIEKVCPKFSNRLKNVSVGIGDRFEIFSSTEGGLNGVLTYIASSRITQKFDKVN